MTVKEALIMTGSTEKEALKHEAMGSILYTISEYLEAMLFALSDVEDILDTEKAIRNEATRLEKQRRSWGSVRGVDLVYDRKNCEWLVLDTVL